MWAPSCWGERGGDFVKPKKGGGSSYSKTFGASYLKLKGNSAVAVWVSPLVISRKMFDWISILFNIHLAQSSEIYTEKWRHGTSFPLLQHKSRWLQTQIWSYGLGATISINVHCVKLRSRRQLDTRVNETLWWKNYINIQLFITVGWVG